MMVRALAVAVVSLAWIPAIGSAQQVTRGSSLNSPANVPFGCEATVELPSLFGGSGDFLLAPTGQPSCTWWSSGIASQVGTTNTGFVPTTGTVTNVRVKSGPNPAPLRIVQLRSAAGCCTIVRHTEPFAPTPNGVTQVTVNWVVEVVRDSVAGVSTTDIIGFSAPGSGGTLPLSDQGPGTHTPQAAFAAGVHSGTMTAPAGQPGALLGLNYRAAIGYEPLLQYDFVPCPALNNVPVAPGTLRCPGQNIGPTPGGANAGPVAIPSNGQPATLRRGVLPIALACSLDIGCSGILRLAIASGAVRARQAQTKTLATKRFRLAKGRDVVRVRLSKRAVARLRGARPRITATVTVPGQPTARRTIRIRRG